MSTERGIDVEELKKKLEELGRAFEEFKRINDSRLAEISKFGTSHATTESALAKANSDIDRLTSERDSMVKEIDGIKTAMNRAGHGGEGGKNAEVEQEKAAKAAHEKYLRKGERGMSVEEKTLLSTDSNPDGGYLVRPELSAMVVKKVFESSPMREICGQAAISTMVLDIVEDLDEAASGWVGENGARSATNTPQLKQVSIPVHELHASPKATQSLLDDAMWNVEAWLAGKVAEKFGRDEATAFVTGTGVNKPRGFAAYANGTSFGTIEQVVSGHATLLQADGLFSLQNALKEPYQANAMWLLQRVTVSSLRKLKDGTGRYIWQPGLTESAPGTILGRPYRMAADVAAEGAGNLAIAYGDFKQGYLIVDRIGVRVLRDPFTSKPNVLFYTTKRVGGDVVNFEAIKLGKCST